MIRILVLFLTTLASTGVPVPAPGAAAPAPFDSSAFRHVSSVEPFRTLALHGRAARMDSLARARCATTLARGERDSLAIARALDAVVEAGTVAGRGRDPGLLDQAERALAIHTRHPGPDSLLLSRTLLAKGELHRRRREFDEALASVVHALAIRARVLPARDPDVAAAHRYLALVHASQASLAGMPHARLAYEVALEQYGPEDIRTGVALNILGAMLNLAGDKLAALDALERAQSIVEAAYDPDDPEIPRGRTNVALLAMFVGDYARARAGFEGAIAASESRTPVDSLLVAKQYDALAECLNDFGDFEGALDAIDRSLGLLRRVTRPEDRSVGGANYQRHRALQGLGRATEAAACYDTAMRVQRALNPDSSGLAVMVFDGARLARAAGDTARALAWAGRAARLASLHADPDAPVLSEYGLLMAQVLDDANRPAEALPWLARARAWADSLVGPASPGRVRLLLEEARAHRLLGDPGAVDVALAAATLRAEHLRAGARGFSERQALLYARDGLGLDPLLSLAAAGALDGPRRRAAHERTAAARALVLDEIAARQHLAREAASPEAHALLDSLERARGALARWLVRGDAASEPSLRAARAAADRFENALAALDPGRPAAGEESGSPLERLAPGDALVSYAAYDEALAGARVERRMLAFVARAGADPVVVPLGAAAEIDGLVAAWRRDVALGLAGGDGAEAERRARESGRRLRERAWDPVAARAAGASRVLLVPEGGLSLVDFAALPSRSGGYLVDEAALLARLGAERDLARPARPRQDAGALPLLAVGGADFESHAAPGVAAPGVAAPTALRRGEAVACPDFREVRFHALPGAAHEAEEAAALWRGAGRAAVVLAGAGAGEAEFKRAAPRSAALHVATHGFFLGEDCGHAAAARARGIGGMAPAAADEVAPRGAESPLRLAGLAFAGANRRAEAPPGSEDGILTAQEIASMDLRSVSDVVLSACDSGLGDVAAGEGVLGLGRAFRIAGARSLVMSLWPVDDRAAREWMRRYWESRLLRAEGVPEAARTAARDRLAALRSARRPTPPAAWAGFVASGDGR